MHKAGFTQMQNDIELAMNGRCEMHGANAYHNRSEDICADYRE